MRPNIQKPDFKLPTSSISNKLPDFLAQMAAANKELNEQIAAGKNVAMEVNDDDDAAAGQHIEMNLGLGVLEERKDGDSSSDEESDDDDNDNVMQKLKGEKKTGKEKDVGIEEL